MTDLQLDLRMPGDDTTGAGLSPISSTRLSAASRTFERMASKLELTGAYRVLRRLTAPPSLPANGRPVRRAVVVDVETTGLDHSEDHVIELAMVAFDYSVDGQILGIRDSFQSFNDPGRPLSPFVTRLTGITDEMVAGRRVDPVLVDGFLADSSLVLAHNASFDRPFCERLSSRFAVLPWGCSLREIAWSDEGFEGARLGQLAIGHGLFFAGHRALDDCVAAVSILARQLPVSGRTALAVLLDSARKARWRVRAVGAPFAARTALKARGYRWDGREGPLRGWYADVDDAGLAVETAYLRDEIYGRADAPIDVREISAFDRYSDRC